MKLIRFGAPERERPGIIAPDGSIRDVSRLLEDLGGDYGEAFFSANGPTLLTERIAVEASRLPIVSGDERLGPPTRRPPNIICIGLNYADHASESRVQAPVEPVIFQKATSAWSGPFDPIRLPVGSRHTDWEVELACVIGRRCSRVRERDALGLVAGYILFHDVSEREFQLHRSGQWCKGKSCETFAPAGPWLVTPEEVPDPQRLDMWLKVNGRIRQSCNTREMLFPVARLISYVSGFMTLLPGDVLATGTPAGVGLGMPVPEYLRPGDVVELGIDGLGVAKQLLVPGDE